MNFRNSCCVLGALVLLCVFAGCSKGSPAGREFVEPDAAASLEDRRVGAESGGDADGVHTAGSSAHDGSPQSEVAGYWSAKVPDFRANAARLQATPLQRAEEPVSFTTGDGTLSMSIAPDASTRLFRNGKEITAPESKGWAVVNWTSGPPALDGTRTPIDNMRALGPDELMLWSGDGHFRALVKIVGRQRHLNFELIHMSNDPETGSLTGDWQGHWLELDVATAPQADGWMLNTMFLNPMSELLYNNRNAMVERNGIGFRWPYAIWAQTDDRPQPQGMIGVYGFKGDEEFDDVMIDVWVDEPTLPRPHRAANRDWTRAEVEAWLDEVVAYHTPPRIMFSFETKNDPDSLYRVADLAETYGVSLIGLHNWTWQGATIGEPNQSNFPNGMADVEKLRRYYDKRGLDFRLHGFGAIFMTRDTKYGEPALEHNLNDGLAIAARCTVVEDVAPNQVTFLLKPDVSLYPWLKEGTLPREWPPWGRTNSGHGSTFPPYFEGNHTTLAFQGRVRTYECELTEDNLWRVTLNSWRQADQHDGLREGETVHIIVNGTPSWMVPDPRSDMYVEMADDYSQILNAFRGGPVYDGAGWSEPLGTWGLRKMVQMVYERLDHPVKGHPHFGFTDQKFKRVQKAEGGRPGAMTVAMGDIASYTSSVDDTHKSLNDKIESKDIYVRGNHKGVELNYAERHGAWAELMNALRLWTELRPHLSEDLKKRIGKRYEKLRNTRQDLYIPSETETTWTLTKTRTMLREGIDGSWKLIPERPSVAPRQFLQADGKGLEGLGNPYAAQVPSMEIHVMASMSSQTPENLNLMPGSQSELIVPEAGKQELQFEGDSLLLRYDNTASSSEAWYRFRPEKEKIPYWMAKPVHGRDFLDFGSQRGISITVEGDGSGAVLLFSYGPSFPRSFAIDIDFVGRRTFEFPNGEMINNRFDWDAFGGQTITSFKYHRVDRFQLYFNRVPAGKKASVRVVDIRTMAEDHEIGLINPSLQLNGVSARIQGTIPYNHYIRYAGGSVARIYDQDWHFVQELPVTAEGALTAVPGDNSFRVSAPESPDTWVSCRIKVADVEHPIVIPKP